MKRDSFAVHNIHVVLKIAGDLDGEKVEFVVVPPRDRRSLF